MLVNSGNPAIPAGIVDDAISALLPAYGERRVQAAAGATKPRPNESIPPIAYVGEWKGSIQTFHGDVPVGFKIEPSGEVTAEVGKEPPVKLNGMRFNLTRMAGRTTADLGVAEDTGNAPQQIEFYLYVRQGALQGAVVAAPGLPFWGDLKKVDAK